MRVCLLLSYTRQFLNAYHKSLMYCLTQIIGKVVLLYPAIKKTSFAMCTRIFHFYVSK